MAEGCGPKSLAARGRRRAMRLTCPECGAVYEVPESAIPAGGRDVQCTNCGHGWFHRPDADEPLEAEPVEAEPFEEPEEEPLGPPPPPVDPRLRRVLREEAEREVEARRAERRQGPRPLDEVHPPHAARRRLDPRDIDERGLSPAAPWEERRPPEPRRRGASFAAGFVLALIAAGVLAAAYVYDEAVVEAVPALAEPMAGFVEAVDRGRLALDAAARDVAGRVGALIATAEEG